MSIINKLFEKLDPLIVKACVKISDRAKARRTIYAEDDPYLTRFYLDREEEDGPKGFMGVYLHYFHSGDEDEALHNHPWGWSFSVILTNGYIEERWDPKTQKVRRRKILPGSINVIRANDFHRVDLIDPSRGAWTLFFSGKRVREEWGFWWPGVHEFIPHYNFTRSRVRNVGSS